jgi:hypothetical protein
MKRLRFPGRLFPFTNEVLFTPSALNQPLAELPKEAFVRAWCSVAYLFPGLHPDGFEDADSGWPRVLKRLPPRHGVVRTLANWPTRNYIPAISNGAGCMTRCFRTRRTKWNGGSRWPLIMVSL